MAKKGYLVSAYRSINNTDKLAAYAKLAGPAFAKYGARYIARGDAAQAYEAGIKQRIVIVEFESVAAGFGYSLGLGTLLVKQITMKADRREHRARQAHRRQARPRPALDVALRGL